MYNYGSIIQYLNNWISVNQFLNKLFYLCMPLSTLFCKEVHGVIGVLDTENV
jgi:hypothetical protein